MDIIQEEEACCVEIQEEETCATEPQEKPSFSEDNEFAFLGLRPEILTALKKAGFKEPSPIQREVIPHILAGVDVVAQAQTGTGKTAAFGLPALHKIQNSGNVEVLVITPTRELTSQVSEELQRLGAGIRVKIATVYGGKSTQNQIDMIRRGAQIVVATPGRLLDLLESGKVPALKPSLVIVDEADEMLDMGFLEDIQAIFEFLPEERQTLLFSATMPAPIQGLAQRILKDPITVKATKTQTSNENISQFYSVVQDSERDEAVIRLFEAQDMSKAILFCKTKKEVDRLSQVLNQRGHLASALHGDMEQSQRENVTQNFRTGASRILVATDVAARGLNILDVTHVINFHIPFDADNYVHRIGRTGRAGRTGVSITLTTPKELGKLMHFQQKAGGVMERRSIPSKQEIRAAQVQRLTAEIKHKKPALEIESLIASSETDAITIAGQLLSWILAQNPINGPDVIGVQGDVSMKKEKRTYPRRDREERGFGGGYRDRPARSFNDKAPRPFKERESRPFSDRAPRAFKEGESRGFGFKDREPRPFKDRESRPFSERAPRAFKEGESRGFGFKERESRPFKDRESRPFNFKEKGMSFNDARPSFKEKREKKEFQKEEFGFFPRKKFVHPSETKKPKKRY